MYFGGVFEIRCKELLIIDVFLVFFDYDVLFFGFRGWGCFVWSSLVFSCGGFFFFLDIWCIKLYWSFFRVNIFICLLVFKFWYVNCIFCFWKVLFIFMSCNLMWWWFLMVNFNSFLIFFFVYDWCGYNIFMSLLKVFWMVILLWVVMVLFNLK